MNDTTVIDNVSHVPLQRIHWTPELVNKFWNGLSQTRLTELSFAKLGGRSLIVTVDHLLSAEKTILDYGAGDGDLVQLLCERGLMAAAFEPADERANTLRQKLAKFPNFLGCVDFESENTYDVVFMTEVIEHILDEQLDNSLKKLNSLTKPGGIVIITCPNNEDLELDMVYCPVSNVLFNRWQHVRSFTNIALASLLSKYDFNEIATHKLTFDDNLYVDYDKQYGKEKYSSKLPSYLKQIRENKPTNTSHESRLLYIGRKKGI